MKFFPCSVRVYKELQLFFLSEKWSIVPASASVDAHSL
jgi:hypothetical protein